jgi:hypothetical protein
VGGGAWRGAEVLRWACGYLPDMCEGARRVDGVGGCLRGSAVTGEVRGQGQERAAGLLSRAVVCRGNCENSFVEGFRGKRRVGRQKNCYVVGL